MSSRAPVLVTAALILLAASSLQADLLFDARRDFYAGDYPRDVAIGDFNGDDHQDLAIVLKDDWKVGILLGNGDGTFQEIVTYQTAADSSDGEYPYSVAIGELNGDDYEDLVVANWGDHNIGFLMGDGDGTFATADTTIAGGGPNCVILADFNEDTILDVVTANWYQHNISILLGDGTGDFTRPAVWQYAVGNSPYTVAAGDFDEDDDLDVAIANFDSDNVSILTGNGDGTFAAADSFAAGEAPHDIAIADFDHDNHQDLVVPNRDSDDVTVLFGNGDGTFPTSATLMTGDAPYSVVTGDFDGDDNPDFAVCCRYDHAVYVYLGNGAGGFDFGTPYGVSEEPYSMAVGDFDEDDNEDIAVACRGGEVISILYGRGDGTFVETPRYDSGIGPGDLVVADFDGDNNLDIAVANGGTEDVGILLGTGNGTFVYDSGFGAGDYPGAIVAGLFDDDEHVDIATAAGNDRRVSVHLGDGDGTFTPGTGFDISYPYGLVCAELDGRDGPDLIVPGGTARKMFIYTGNGDGTFTSAGSCTTGGETWWTARNPAIGDFNEDGTPDMAVPIGEYNVSQLSILLGNGDGTFEFDATYASEGRGGGLADAGYFDADDHLDVVMTNEHSNNVSIFLGNGDGTLEAASVETVGIEPWDVAAKDFDGDGLIDIAVACSEGWSGMALLLGNGDGTFKDPDPYGTEQGSFYLDVGDLNADSRMDVIVSNNWSDRVSVLINIGPNTPVEHAFYATALEDGSVMVRWGLASFTDAQAIRLYRSVAADGPFGLLVEEALPAAAFGGFRDTTVWPGGTFWYDLRAVLWDGQEESIVHFLPSATVGGSLSLAMHQPMANPFTTQCAFTIDVPNHTGNVHLAVYNARGQLVSTLIDEPLPRGRHPVVWDGSDWSGHQSASGVYFVRLEVGGAHAVGKALLLR